MPSWDSTAMDTVWPPDALACNVRAAVTRPAVRERLGPHRRRSCRRRFYPGVVDTGLADLSDWNQRVAHQDNLTARPVPPTQFKPGLCSNLYKGNPGRKEQFFQPAGRSNFEARFARSSQPALPRQRW
jgi:hypothetical protein